MRSAPEIAHVLVSGGLFEVPFQDIVSPIASLRLRLASPAAKRKEGLLTQNRTSAEPGLRDAEPGLQPSRFRSSMQALINDENKTADSFFIVHFSSLR